MVVWRYAEEIDAALSCLLSQTGPSSSGPIVQRPPKDPPLPPGHAAEQAKAARAQPSWLQLVSVSSAGKKAWVEVFLYSRALVTCLRREKTL